MNIIVAHKAEAQPFLQMTGLSWQQCSDEKAFSMFECDQHKMIVCGQGRLSVEKTVQRLHEKNHADQVAWLNFGIAGSADFLPGELVQADQVRSIDGQSSYSLPLLWPDKLPVTQVNTGDSIETQYDLSGVYDMEAYYLAEQLQGASAPFHCVKLITDGPEYPLSELNLTDIRRMIEAKASHIAALFHRGEL